MKIGKPNLPKELKNSPNLQDLVGHWSKCVCYETDSGRVTRIYKLVRRQKLFSKFSTFRELSFSSGLRTKLFNVGVHDKNIAPKEISSVQFSLNDKASMIH